MRLFWRFWWDMTRSMAVMGVGFVWFLTVLHVALAPGRMGISEATTWVQALVRTLDILDLPLHLAAAVAVALTIARWSRRGWLVGLLQAGPSSAWPVMLPVVATANLATGLAVLALWSTPTHQPPNTLSIQTTASAWWIARPEGGYEVIQRHSTGVDVHIGPPPAEARPLDGSKLRRQALDTRRMGGDRGRWAQVNRWLAGWWLVLMVGLTTLLTPQRRLAHLPLRVALLIPPTAAVTIAAQVVLWRVPTGLVMVEAVVVILLIGSLGGLWWQWHRRGWRVS